MNRIITTIYQDDYKDTFKNLISIENIKKYKEIIIKSSSDENIKLADNINYDIFFKVFCTRNNKYEDVLSYAKGLDKTIEIISLFLIPFLNKLIDEFIEQFIKLIFKKKIKNH